MALGLVWSGLAARLAHLAHLAHLWVVLGRDGRSSGIDWRLRSPKGAGLREIPPSKRGFLYAKCPSIRNATTATRCTFGPSAGDLLAHICQRATWETKSIYIRKP